MIARIGVDLHNLIAIIPLPGTPLGKMSSPSLDLMTSRRAGERHLPQMYLHALPSRCGGASRAKCDSQGGCRVKARLLSIGVLMEKLLKSRRMITINSQER